jgi:hypothetical protein
MSKVTSANATKRTQVDRMGDSQSQQQEITFQLQIPVSHYQKICGIIGGRIEHDAIHPFA